MTEGIVKEFSSKTILVDELVNSTSQQKSQKRRDSFPGKKGDKNIPVKAR